MRSSELQPTHDNLFETFMSDTIGRNKDVIAFAEILNNLEGSYSIALEGYWGSGKTFFVKQTKMLLDASNEHLHSLPDDEKNAIKKKWPRPSGDEAVELMPQVSVYYDAWGNDNDEDPILSLVYSIMKSVDADSPFSNDTSIVGAAASFLSVFTGKNLSALVDSFRGKNPLDSLRQHKNVEAEVNGFLDSLLSERGNRLVVFVDELDRCRPSFAVKLLERIRHFFMNERITFVFSIDFSELQHTVKKYYGDEFNACRYLDRFFDLRVSLPPANITKFYQSIGFSNDHWTYDIVCDVVIKKYDLSLREISRYVQLARIAAHKLTHTIRDQLSRDKAKDFCLFYIVPIMIGLKITDYERYEAFVRGKDATPLIEVLGEKKDNNFSDLIDSKASRVSEDEWVITSVEEKLKEVYDAVFVNSYSVSPYYKQIGKLQFGEEVREFVMSIVGLFSRYADFSG